MKVHIYSGIQTGPLTKTSTKEMREKKKGTKVSSGHRQKHSAKVPLPLRFDPPQLLWPQWLLGPGGTLGSTKNSKGSGLEESGIPSRTSS